MAHVLVIDDSKIQAGIMMYILKNHGHEVITVHDGGRGFSHALELKPDLILMDIVMPELDGFRVTRQLAKHPNTCHIPVIMTSAKSQETDRLWALRQGACDYIVKPIKEAVLMASVNKALTSISA